MTLRRPLVIVNGGLREIADGDEIPIGLLPAELVTDSELAAQLAAELADYATNAALAAGLLGKVDTTALGVSVATLVGGTVPSAQLPSYVDDVVEYASYASLPPTGEAGKIYIALDTNHQYRWSGSTYVELVQSPGTTDAVAEGSTNLYFTAARVRAAVLTGLSLATGGVISAADTVLQAFGKLQKQITDALALIPPFGGGSDRIFWDNGQTITTNRTIPPNTNSGSFGPVVIADGVDVVISDGSNWTIV